MGSSANQKALKPPRIPQCFVDLASSRWVPQETLLAHAPPECLSILRRLRCERELQPQLQHTTMAQTILLKNEAIEVAIKVGGDGSAGIDHILPAKASPQPTRSKHFKDSSAPLIELRLSGEGNASFKSAKSMLGSYVGTRFKYRSHNIRANGRTKTLDVVLHDERTGATAVSHLTIFDGIELVQARVTVRNDSSTLFTVVQVPSIVVGDLTRSEQWWYDYDVSYANNT